MPAPPAHATELSQGRILRFWLPLAGTWLMIASEGPLLAAVIARLPDPMPNLAAWGVALAVAMVVEAPVIMLLSAATALVHDRGSLLRLRRFTHGLNALLTAVMALLLVPSLFELLAGRLLGLPEDVAQRTSVALLLLLPWPAAIGYRRFYQGVLIRRGLTRRVTYGTVVRLSTMAATGLLAASTGRLEGAAVGGLALSAGVVAEAAAARLMSWRAVTELLGAGDRPLPDDPTRALGPLATFYWPLATTSFLGLGIQPLVTFFIGHGRAPVESLAVLPVINALVFLPRSLAFALQEVGIALIGERQEGYPALRRFATTLSVALGAAFLVVVWTPLAGLWFGPVSGLSAELARLALLPARILALLPVLTVIQSLQRAVMVHSRRTAPVTWATAVEVLVVTLGLAVAILWLDLVGAVAAAVALMVGRLAANLTLAAPTRRALSEAELRGQDAAVRRSCVSWAVGDAEAVIGALRERPIRSRGRSWGLRPSDQIGSTGRRSAALPSSTGEPRTRSSGRPVDASARGATGPARATATASRTPCRAPLRPLRVGRCGGHQPPEPTGHPERPCDLWHLEEVAIQILTRHPEEAPESLGGGSSANRGRSLPRPLAPARGRVQDDARGALHWKALRRAAAGRGGRLLARRRGPRSAGSNARPSGSGSRREPGFPRGVTPEEGQSPLAQSRRRFRLAPRLVEPDQGARGVFGPEVVAAVGLEVRLVRREQQRLRLGEALALDQQPAEGRLVHPSAAPPEGNARPAMASAVLSSVSAPARSPELSSAQPRLRWVEATSEWSGP